MKNNKTTKRALLSSVLALVLCFSMLLGTTFAWFTDTAVSGNNIIKTGNLDMKLSYKPYGATNTTWTEVDENTVLFGKDALYEPGYTEAIWLKVENIGSLAFRYDLAFNVSNETPGKNVDGDTFNLSDYLVVNYMAADSTDFESTTCTTRESLLGYNWDTGVASFKNNIAVVQNGIVYSADDATKVDKDVAYALVVISMPTTVGNEANHNGTDVPKIDFTLTALATQLAYEEDSFGDDYDEDSTYEVEDNVYVDSATGDYFVIDTEGLSTIAKLASEDSSITSVIYKTESAEIEVPVVSDNSSLDNALSEANNVIILADGNYLIPDSAKGKTLTVVGGENANITVADDGAAEGDIDYSFEGSTVTFENVTIKVQGSSYPGYARMNATYNNCTIEGTYTLYGESTFNNCKFDLKNGYVWTWGAPKATFNNCTFEDSLGNAKAILVHNTVSTEIIVKDCNFVATTAAATWDGIPVAAVSIDPANSSSTVTVKFEGNNTYSDAFNGLYQLKYAPELSSVSVTVNGEAVTVPTMKDTHP